MTVFSLALIVVFLLASAFFALSEMALVGLSKIRLRHWVSQGVKGAQPLSRLVSELDKVIASIVLANNFTNTAISALGTALCIAWLGTKWGVLVATFLMGTVIILFGEITPKVFAIRHADRVALTVTPSMRFLVRFLKPVTWFFTSFSDSFLRLLGVEARARSPLVTEEELKIMIEVGRKEGVLEERERILLHRIFEFGDLKVKDVMVPLAQVVSVSRQAGHEEILQVLTEEGHSRLPIYRDSPDEIIGIIYAQEILHIWREGMLIVLEDLVHPPFQVSPNRRITDLLQEFQKRRVQIAIVVDEKGKALGLATLEDLIEEIVGEIEEDPGEASLDRSDGA